MRPAAVLVALALLVAGCSDDGDDEGADVAAETTSSTAPADGTTTSTTEATDTTAASTTTTVAEPAEGELTLVLETDGVGFIGAGDDDSVDSLEFSSAEEDAVMGISAALGDPIDQGDQEECPAGPATFARWDGGFSTTFQDGLFVGWSADEAGLVTVGNVGVGSTLDELLAEHPDGTVEETSLGFELVGADLSALLTGPDGDDTVEALWAGTTCIFR